jgi:hypothetical protein
VLGKHHQSSCVRHVCQRWHGVWGGGPSKSKHAGVVPWNGFSVSRTLSAIESCSRYLPTSLSAG